ncbi:MAG: hypothetical protein NTV29_09395 [Planctomycetota bacterium]|nr:hypothetical protein [Planctomycetota bacterium]
MDHEKQAIIKFHFDHPLNVYRRLKALNLSPRPLPVKCSQASRKRFTTKEIESLKKPASYLFVQLLS